MRAVFVLVVLALGSVATSADIPATFTNSLGLRFVSIPTLTNVMFSVWLTRVQDFREFVKDHSNNGGYDYHHGKTAYRFNGNYDYEKGRTPQIMTSNGWAMGSSTNGWDNPGFDQKVDCPVVCINWEDA